MAAQLSRRGLFRALRAEAEPEGTDGARDAVRVVARIGEGCVEPRGVLCRRCGDECDARAISFRLLGAGRTQAVLDADKCTGCKACMPVCPVEAIELIPMERAALIAGLAEMSRAS